MARVVVLLFVLTFGTILKGQDTAAFFHKSFYPYSKPFTSGYFTDYIDSAELFNPPLFNPFIGIGPSILTFYGDVTDKKFIPSVKNKIGFNISASEYVKKYLFISARAMFGTVGATENGPRFANFVSKIRSGGINVSYNFDHFLPSKRRLEPFVTTGLEYFEFLTKTDLLDASKKQYHYWSNGANMSLDENDPNAAKAIPLSRDFNSETDVRKFNYATLGKYAEHSLAIPLGIGLTVHIIPRLDLKVGTTMHFSFTDYIDGITPENKGIGKGNSNKDKFLETYFTLSFNLFNPDNTKAHLSKDELLALENEDTDGDGVTDFKDSCQGTPSGATVNEKGCPIDTDNDRFPDYSDKELNSPVDAFVDDNGVAMNDSTIAQKWWEWSDTAYQYVKYINVVNPVAYAGGKMVSNVTKESTVVYKQELVVVLGTYNKGVPPNELTKLLSISDIKNIIHPDSSTSYTTASYFITSEAEKRRDELISSGFKNAKVMALNKNGYLSEVASDAINIKEKNLNQQSIITKGIVYYVQVGAFSKKTSPSKLKSSGSLIEYKPNDNLFKYLKGPFFNSEDAKKQKDELVKNGVKGAFIATFNNGERVSLSSTTGGGTQSKSNSTKETKINEKQNYSKIKGTVNKKLIYFRVQVGVFENEPSAEILNRLNKIPGLEKKKKSTGVNQYVAGKFNSFDGAKKFRDEIASKYATPDAFVIAFYKDELISLQEALEYLK